MNKRKFTTSLSLIAALLWVDLLVHIRSWINIASNYYYHHFTEKETEAHGSKATYQILGRAACEPDNTALETRLLLKKRSCSILNLYFSLSRVVKYAPNFYGEIVA